MQCMTNPVSLYSCQPLAVVTICYFISYNRCVGISHHGLYLYFLNDWWYWTSFHVLISHLYILFGKMSLHVFCPFSNWIAYCFEKEFWDVFVYSRYVFVRYVVCKYFLPVYNSFLIFSAVYCRVKVFNFDEIQSVKFVFYGSVWCYAYCLSIKHQVPQIFSHFFPKVVRF